MNKGRAGEDRGSNETDRCPLTGVTLVSISRITAAGHKAIFDGPSLEIFNSMKKLLGEIPVSKGLYCVEHPSLLTL
jgi:hypothetical protein